MLSRLGSNAAVATLASGIAMVLLGCGSRGPEIAYVAGRVTMDGKPLADATVVFIPENGRPAGATTDEEGHYELNFSGGRKGALPGPSMVRIMTMRDASEGEDGKAILARRETVPAKYNTDSTLTFEVEANQRNTANFDLESTGSDTSRDS